MANITAAEVNKLRQQTGAGMMDCKKALVEAEGDFDKAIEILRKKGQKVASSRSDRDTHEGVVIARNNDEETKAYVIMLNCETDFVAKNQEVVDFAYDILNLAARKDVPSLEELKATPMADGRTVEEHITEMIGKTGEKFNLSSYEVAAGAKTFVYIHPGNRVASIAALNKSDVENIDQAGKDVVMQIAAMAPVAIDKKDVDPTIVEKEIEIGKDQARQEGKAEELLEKIAMGKLNK
ncbi:MAG: translation elongation factor Ts, partial [Bacteroidales bacterium]